MSLLYDLTSAYPHEADPLAAEAVTSYLGFDVLSVTHDMREAVSEAFGRRGEMVTGATGPRHFDDRGGVPFPVRSFLWTANDRTSCNAIRTFLDARKGRLVPFWVPTCCHDLRLAADAPDVASTLTIRRAGYLDFLYSQACRRYLAFFPPGGAMVVRKVTGGSTAGLTTEQVTLDSAAGVALPADGTVISYLVLCRLAEDLTTLRWFSTWGCEASIRFAELPREVPA